ncbi:MAG: hypothetical protein J0H49_05495 [Acidobacteria bacterium]|nr:hypothetical protein [Acidobacteriota bacterium]
MAHDKSTSAPPRLTREQRASVYDKACGKISKLYFDPDFRGVDWRRLVAENREAVISETEPERFETAVHDLVRQLGTSHTGFFHESVRRVPARLAIGATCVRDPSDPDHWVIRDVHQGGPAAKAGIRPCDVLMRINGTACTPPTQTMFPMGTTASIRVRRDGTEIELAVAVPAPRSKKQPHAEPEAVLSSRMTSKVGYIKVAVLPGLFGIDVSRQMDRAFDELRDCDRLVLDLRGHLGGGLAVLHLMSHLTAERIPAGFTLTRRGAEEKKQKDQLPRLDRLPKHKFWGLLSMAIRYGGRDSSMALVTEGLGPKKCHGRIAILINEGTISAGEMVCAFARERGLATLVGTTTAGRLIPGSGFKVGHGYMVIFPKAAYVTWDGQSYEGRGIAPDIEVAWSSESFRQGRDNQLEAAIEVVSEL